MPIVSAIIPAYNGVSRYLNQSIESVLAQTLKDVELIVVDDASTDDTARLVFRFPQARYVKRIENGGQATARNDGARLSKGKYLAFLDQDDIWEPSFLEDAVALLENEPDAGVVHCDGYKINDENTVVEYAAGMQYLPTITQILRGGHDVVTSGSVFRKACFDAVGGYDDQLALWEDIDLGIRIYQRYRPIHLPRLLYCYRLHANTASRYIGSENMLRARHRFLLQHGPSCKPHTPESRALAWDWAQYYGDLGKHYLQEGRVHEARDAFWTAMKYRPFNRKAFLRLLRSYVLWPAPARTSS